MLGIIGCTIGWSEFAIKQHAEGMGNSFFTISHEKVLDLVKENWDKRTPGAGEVGLDRKILVPVPAEGFFMPIVDLVDGMPLRAEVVRRQPHEDPYVDVYIDYFDAKAQGLEAKPANFVNIVLYSVEALLENNGTRSTEADWEIVCVLASKTQSEPMMPLTMARNFLEMAGGTFTSYTALQFAQAIYYHSQRGIKIKKKPTE